MHDVTVAAGVPSGDKVARAAGAAAFGTVVAAAVVLPLAFSGLTPSSGDVKPLALSILVAVGLLAWLVAGAARGELRWPRTRVNVAVIAFLALNVFSAALSPYPRASLMEVWRVLVLAGFFFLALHAARDERRVVWLARTIAAMAGLVAFYGVLQRFGLDPFAWGGTTVRGRVSSTLGHPNFLAAYLAMSLPVTGSLFLSCRTRKVLALLGADVAIQAICLVFTFSRGGWLGALGAAAALVFVAGWPGRFRGFFTRRAARGWALAGVLAAAVALGSAAGSEYSPFTSKSAAMSIRTRVEIYRGGLGMFAARPVLGHGTGTFHTVFPKYRPREYPEVDPRPNVMHAHCEHLNLADEMGVVGLGVFAWLVFAALFSGWMAAGSRGGRAGRFVMTGFLAGLVGLLVHGTFCIVLRVPGPASHLWLVFGLLAGSATLAKPRRLRLGRSAGAVLASASAVVMAFLLYEMEARPFLSNVRELEGSALKWHGRWDDAVKAYSRAVDVDPWNLEARYERAVSLVELERYDDALGGYREIEALAPDYVHLHYNMGMLYAFLHDWEEAGDEFRRADATSALPLGFDLDRALAVIGSSRPDAEKELDIFAMVARARFGEEARLRGSRAAELAPEIAAKGTKYYLAGRLGRAEAMFRLALSFEPNDRLSLNNLAGIHFKRKEYDEAIGLCERLVKLDPGDAHVGTNLAKAWLLKGDKAKAKAILTKVLSTKPDYPEAVKTLRLMEGSR